jgi:uncharacterized peroxidase-related enzyme
MPLIQTVAPSQAQGQVAEVYRQAEAIMGRVPNAFQMYSGSPVLLETQWQQVAYFMKHPTLSFPLLALTRMLVSQDHRCDYCIDFNAAMLIERAGFTPEQIVATKRDPAAAPLDAREKAMLLFALKATRAPHEIGAADIDNLKALGWAESDMLDAVTHAARNMAADVVFNTFKVERDE